MQLTLSQTKQTMQVLLLSTLFDDFYFEQGRIITAFRQEFDGHLQADFYPPEERPKAALIRWSEIRPLYTAQIKGHRLPLEITLTLCPSHALQQQFSEASDVCDGLDLRLHFQYRDGQLTCTSAASWQQFSMNQEPLKAWDSFICDWLVEIGLPFSFSL